MALGRVRRRRTAGDIVGIKYLIFFMKLSLRTKRKFFTALLTLGLTAGVIAEASANPLFGGDTFSSPYVLGRKTETEVIYVFGIEITWSVDYNVPC